MFAFLRDTSDEPQHDQKNHNLLILQYALIPHLKLFANATKPVIDFKALHCSEILRMNPSMTKKTLAEDHFPPLLCKNFI